MAVADKYQSLIDLANQLGVSGLNTREENGVLYIDGVAGSAGAKQQLWDEYNRIDPDYRSGDLVLNISAPEGSDESKTYTVQSGDTLSGIGSQYGVSWQKIFEANRDKLDDPDKIYPGQKIEIPMDEGRGGGSPGIAPESRFGGDSITDFDEMMDEGRGGGGSGIPPKFSGGGSGTDFDI